MISVFWLLTGLLGGDPCAPDVDAADVRVDPESMEISIARSYGVPWAVCAQEKGGKQPSLRVTASDGSGSQVLLEKPVELTGSLRASRQRFSATASGCRDAPIDRRDANAVLQGPVGSRHWYNRRTITVELIAEGPLAPLAFKTQTEVFCRACSDQHTVSSSYYINDFDKHTARMVLSLDRARHECARGGGRIMLRRFWSAPDADPWVPLQPYEVIDDLQDRLKPQGDVMMYELIEPAAKFCKAGKAHVFELVGVDEYATIMLKSYGPSDAIHRANIEFLKCK